MTKLLRNVKPQKLIAALKKMGFEEYIRKILNQAKVSNEELEKFY